MFCASVLHAFPALQQQLDDFLSNSGFRALADVEWTAASNGGLSGLRFIVSPTATDNTDHHHYAEIVSLLGQSVSSENVLAIALNIFEHLANAEAQVHGIEKNSVAFHEVGAVDSIIDIVSAAFLIDGLGFCEWSCSPLPIGSGHVNCAHGMLPIPAPATTILLQGMSVINDGIMGERVTPTGAAILKHLLPDFSSSQHKLRVGETGIGLGKNTFPGISNALRILSYYDDHPNCIGRVANSDNILELSFDIDDQTPEDLACALDHLRELDVVREVVQLPAIGKSGRLLSRISVLCDPQARQYVADKIFDETTTLGIRQCHYTREILHRQSISDRSTGMSVKLAQRSSVDRTAKAEMDELRNIPGHVNRQRRRRELEDRALQAKDADE
jgi:hypothetical protein